MITILETDPGDFCDICEEEAKIKIEELDKCLCGKCARKLSMMIMQEV